MRVLHCLCDSVPSASLLGLNAEIHFLGWRIAARSMQEDQNDDDEEHDQAAACSSILLCCDSIDINSLVAKGAM